MTASASPSAWSSIRRLLEDWEEASPRTTVRTLREDRKTCLFLCYVMESAIQTALDLSNHLIANLDLPRPASYRESFQILGAHGWIPKRLVFKLEELAGFRNILAHQSPDLDYAKMLPHVRRSWKTLREFSRTVWPARPPAKPTARRRGGSRSRAPGDHAGGASRLVAFLAESC